MAISLARMPFIASGGSGTRSRPRHRIWPATMRPGGIGTSFKIDMAVTVLPHPDSPTTPKVSPLATVRSTPSTACTMPSSVAKCVLRPRISSSFSPTPELTSHALPSHHLAGVERIAQSIADEIDAQDGEEDGGAGEHGPIGGDVEVVLGIEQDPAPGGDIGGKAETKERKGRLAKEGGGAAEGPGTDTGPKAL